MGLQSTNATLACGTCTNPQMVLFLPQCPLHVCSGPRWNGIGPMGGALCAARMLCKKQANVDPFSPLAKVTAVTTVFPDTGLPQIPPQSTNSSNEFKQTMFHTSNARMLSVFHLNLLFLPCGRVLTQWWVVFRVVTGKLIIVLPRPKRNSAQIRVFCRIVVCMFRVETYHRALCPRCVHTLQKRRR